MSPLFQDPAPLTPAATSLTLSRTVTNHGLYSYTVRDSSGQSVTASIPGWFQREVTFTCKEAGGLQTNRHESWVLPTNIPNAVLSELTQNLRAAHPIGKTAEDAAKVLWSIASANAKEAKITRLDFRDASPLDAFCQSPTIKDLRAKGTPVTTR